MNVDYRDVAEVAAIALTSDCTHWTADVKAGEIEVRQRGWQQWQ